VSKTQLVVGGAGFIGSALVRELVERGPVCIFDDLSNGKSEWVESVGDVELIVASVLDEEALATAIQGVGVVYNLACLGVRHSIHSPKANHDVNATGALNVLQTALHADVDRFVHVSSSEVYGSAHAPVMDEMHPTFPNTVYGGGKLAGEAYARAYQRTYGLPVTVVRPFNAYGPRCHHEGDSGEVIPRFIVRAMNGLAPVVFGSGTHTRDFTYVRDTARAIAAAAVGEAAIGQTYCIGTGVETTISHVAQVVLAAVGREDLTPEHGEARPGDVARLTADSRKAERELGWKPAVDLESGVALLLDWYRETGINWAEELEAQTTQNWVSAS